MQASTVLMAAVGLGLMRETDSESAVNDLIDLVKNTDFSFLKSFIEAETEVYDDEYIIYRTDDFGVSVLTDTTERSPTFSLPAFENYRASKDPVCLSYLMMQNAEDPRSAWHKLLHREPRCLEWKSCKSFAGLENFYGYDISENIMRLRNARTEGKSNTIFDVMRQDGNIHFGLKNNKYDMPVPDSLLYQHLLLKMTLNTHSTLIMGRLGRYEGNLMTYVKPSNYKLIDRSIRYIRTLYQAKTDVDIEYNEVAAQLFHDMKDLSPDEPIVMKVLDNMFN
jgi:N-acetylmuramic acid 6-phosphate etherase